MPRPDGAVGMWAIQAPNPKPERSANKDCPHFHGPTQKKSFIEKPPQGCCGMESAEPGPAADSGECGKRGQSKPRTPNRERAQIRIVHRFPCSPRRREPKSASSQMQRRQAEGWQGCGQSRPRTRNLNAARTRIVHRLSTLSAPPRTKNGRTTRKDKNPERCPGSSSEADESDPAQPRRCKTRTNPQQPAPAAIPPEF